MYPLLWLLLPFCWLFKLILQSKLLLFLICISFFIFSIFVPDLKNVALRLQDFYKFGLAALFCFLRLIFDVFCASGFK